MLIVTKLSKWLHISGCFCHSRDANFFATQISSLLISAESSVQRFAARDEICREMFSQRAL